MPPKCSLEIKLVYIYRYIIEYVCEKEIMGDNAGNMFARVTNLAAYNVEDDKGHLFEVCIVIVKFKVL